MFILTLVNLCVFIKCYLLSKIINIKISLKELKLACIIYLSYDIGVDIASMMAQSPAFLRPWWFNILEAIGVLWMLFKTHSIKIICDFFIFKKYKVNNIDFMFIILSLFFGFLRFFCYLYLTIKSNYSTETFSLSQRFLFEVYLSQFAVTFYQFFIIVTPISLLIKNYFDTNIPLPIKRIIKNFLLYCLIPKLILDNLQTSTLSFLLFLFGESNIIFSSSEIPQKISIISLLFFYTIYIMLKDLKHLEFDENFLKKDIEEDENIETFSLTLEPQNIENIDYNGNIIFEIIHNKLKSIIQNNFNIPVENIIIEHNQLNGFPHYLLIKNNIILKKHLDFFKYIYIDEIESYEYFFDKIKFIEIKDFLKKNKFKVIIPLMNNNDLFGVICIKEIESKKNNYIIKDLDINFLKAIAKTLINLKNNTNNHSLQSIINFKIKSIDRHINELIHVQNQIINNMESFIEKGNFSLYNINKNNFISNKTTELDSDIINQLIEKTKNSKKESVEILSSKEYTHIAQKINDIKKNNSFISFFSFPLLSIYKQQSVIAFELTDFGKKILLLLPNNQKEVLLFKNELLSIAHNPKPFLFIGDRKKLIIFCKIMSFIKNQSIIFCTYKQESDINFFYNNLYQSHGKNNLIVFYEFENIPKEAQKNILEFYIKNELQDDNTFNNTLYIHLSNGDYIINCHDIITKITTIKEIPTISSHFIVEKDFHETIKNISYLLYGYTIETKEINQIFIEIINKIEKNTNIYDIFENIENLLISYKKNINNEITSPSDTQESILQKAISLKKYALHDKILMKQLIDIFDGNMTKISEILSVNKSSVSRAIKRLNL